jgi:hypothetical protein
MGAYHTLDLELNRKFTLGKHEWDSVTLDRIGALFNSTYVIYQLVHHPPKKHFGIKAKKKTPRKNNNFL